MGELLHQLLELEPRAEHVVLGNVAVGVKAGSVALVGGLHKAVVDGPSSSPGSSEDRYCASMVMSASGIVKLM